MNQTLPVTVLAGLPGAGKTTLVGHLLADHADVRIAVISGGTDDLSNEVARVAATQDFDAIVIEASGQDDPQTIAENLVFDNDIAHLDTIVTLIDAQNFQRDYASTDVLGHDEEGDRTVVETLVAQIEFCDVIVINKTDLISAPALVELRDILHALNPRAELIDAKFGVVPLKDVVNTDRFDFDATSSAPSWLEMLNADPDAASVVAANSSGIGGFVYRARRPFHPERLWSLLHQEWTGVLRSKGFFWLATRSDIGGSLSQAGSALRHGPAGMWWAAQERSEWPSGDAELEAEIAADWFGDADDMSIGDRRQELAIIGTALDEAHWRSAFNACLLTDEEWSQDAQAWLAFGDPFPSWEMDDDDHEHDHDHGDDCDCGAHGHHH
ncbi:cobalamin biosynthesis protein CobW [Burkholderia sp. Leaf177]|uniref:GTP-binding protein n=1 Tax=Burkholderia sp. Leaf177 TaxID=1736287 RepID=UPI0006FD92BE|nr:GTP-binding protein [Burkholderia sp. Leaf177]KQR79758.1 cobalamin biosynthesis protein CobW [Burkholderia sp. Leaf177]